MANGSVTLSGAVTGLPYGSDTIGPLTVSNASAVAAVTSLTLGNGDNTITVPTGSVAAVIVFASGSATTKKLKGAGADTGITVTKVGWCELSFDTSPPANFIINSSAIDTGLTTYIFFL